MTSPVLNYCHISLKKKKEELINGIFQQHPTRGVKLNQTAIHRGQKKSPVTQQKRKKIGKQISEWHVRMLFYSCLHEEAQNGASEKL